MSFVAVAATVVGEGLAATLLGGAMMGGTVSIVNNVVHGQNPFDHVLEGALLGGITAGIAPGVSEATQLSLPAATAVTQGGITALRTGDLGKGLTAGMTAYGMSSLAGSMDKMGQASLEGTATSDLANANAEMAYNRSLADSYANNTNIGNIPSYDLNVSTPSYNLNADASLYDLNATTTPLTPDEIAARAAGDAQDVGNNTSRVKPTTTAAERALAGREAIANNPGAFLKANAKNLMYAGLPMLMDPGPQKALPTTTPTAANIRRFSYDPYSGQYTSQGMYPAAQEKGLASGGIAALANGGAVAFADGGVNAGATGAVQPAPVVLPTDWGVQGGQYDDPNEKIKYFNQNNITADQLLAANQGVTQKDIDWMVGQGYSPYNPAAGSNLYNKNVADWFTSNPNATYADIVKAEDNYLKPEDIAAAMKTAGMSGADIYAATHQNIGPAGNPNSGGLAGLSSNIQYWFNQHPGASLNDVRSEMSKWELSDADIKRAMGKTPEELTTGKITEVYNPAVGAGGNTGAGVVGGGTVVNPNGTVTTSPVIPGIPVGGFTGMTQVKDAYTTGGGSLGYVSPVVKNMDEFNTKYNKQSGDSAAMYDYLTGKSRVYPAATQNKELMKPYSEAVMGVQPMVGRPTQKYIFDKATQTYKANPDYVPVTYDTTGTRNTGLSFNAIKAALATPPADINKWMTDNGVTLEQIAQALGLSLTEAAALYGLTGTKKTATTATTGGGVDTGTTDSGGQGGLKNGGMTQSYAGGGLGSLGGYSDGGQLLKGPGDGVSDSIPASIGNRQPARLADGEFVVPARIVSELGNGSTEAGARKLYAMMDRVQKARGKTTGKDRVATNSRSDKYLPA